MGEIEALVRPGGFLPALSPELSFPVRFPARAVYGAGSAKLRAFSEKPFACWGGFFKTAEKQRITRHHIPTVTFPAGLH